MAFPTETVYGLGADAENVDAVGRIFAVKGRPSTHPLIVHISAAEQLQIWAEGMPKPARILAERFWPGPLTLVLQRSTRVPLAVTGGLQTVALRVPDHPLALALLQAFGGGVAAPSANRFGSVSPTSARHVREELGIFPRTAVDVVLDGGPCKIGVESTIVDCTGERVAILRPGGVTREDLESALGYSIPLGPAGFVRAPGQHPSHYAPLAKVILVDPEELGGEARRLHILGCRVGALIPRPFEHAVMDGHVALMVPEAMTAYAQELYDLLREFDRRGCDVIVASLPAQEGLGVAIADRLRRAAGSQGLHEPAGARRRHAP